MRICINPYLPLVICFMFCNMGQFGSAQETQDNTDNAATYLNYHAKALQKNGGHPPKILQKSCKKPYNTQAKMKINAAKIAKAVLRDNEKIDLQQ